MQQQNAILMGQSSLCIQFYGYRMRIGMFNFFGVGVVEAFLFVERGALAKNLSKTWESNFK
jgi:hypothetical protein